MEDTNIDKFIMGHFLDYKIVELIYVELHVVYTRDVNRIVLCWLVPFIEVSIMLRVVLVSAHLLIVHVSCRLTSQNERQDRPAARL